MHSLTNRANRIGEVCRHIEESDLLNWDNPEEFLHFIGVETVKVCTLSKGVRKEKDGWTPVNKVLSRIYLRRLLKSIFIYYTLHIMNDAYILYEQIYDISILYLRISL